MKVSFQGLIQYSVLAFTQKGKGKPQKSHSHNGLVQIKIWPGNLKNTCQMHYFLSHHALFYPLWWQIKQRQTGIYLSLLPNAQCKSEQVKGNASSKHISDYHCRQRPGTGYLETISNHKPTNKSKLQALKHIPGCKVHTVNIEIYFYANSSNRCCSAIIKWTNE